MCALLIDKAVTGEGNEARGDGKGKHKIRKCAENQRIKVNVEHKRCAHNPVPDPFCVLCLSVCMCVCVVKR